MTVREIVDCLNVDPRTVYRMVNWGDVLDTRVGRSSRGRLDVHGTVAKLPGTCRDREALDADNFARGEGLES